MIVYVVLAILGLSLLWVNREGMESSSALESSQKTAGVLNMLKDQLNSFAALQKEVENLEKNINETSQGIGLYRQNSAETAPDKIDGGFTPVPPL